MQKKMPVRIDRIVILHKLKKTEFVLNELRLKIIAKRYGVKVFKLKKDTGYRASFSFGTSQGPVRISVERSFKNIFIKFDFKPNDLDDKAFLEFDDTTAIFGAGRLKLVLVTGSVSKVEIAVDFIGVDVRNYIYFKPHVHASGSGSKRIGATVYLGASQSQKSFIFYNKAKAPNATTKERTYPNLLRVEARLSGCKITPVQLSGITNPFLKIVISPVKTLKVLFAAKPSLVVAVSDCRFWGAPRAFKMHPIAKQAISTAAKANQAKWWKPATVMRGWPSMVRAQLRFGLFGLAPALVAAALHA